MRRIISVLFTVVALLVLTGCFKIDMTFDIKPDDTVNGSLIFAFDEEMQELMESEGEDVSDTFEEEKLPKGATVEEYNKDGKVGQLVTFKDTPLEELNEFFNDADDEGNEFSFVHKDGKYEFKGNFDATGGDDGLDDLTDGDDAEGTDEDFGAGLEAMMKKMLEDAEFTVSVTFPGKITDTNGKVSGKTVTWDLDVTAPASMNATAEEGSGGGFPVIPVVIGVVVLLAIAGGGFMLMRRK